MSHPTWDLNIGDRGFRAVLRNSRDERFLDFLARALCRVPFLDLFPSFITPGVFLRYYPKVRRRMRADLFGASRIRFWDWLYKRLKTS